MAERLTHSELLELKRWNTPTIYNGWEQITSHDSSADAINIEETCDFAPQLGRVLGAKLTPAQRLKILRTNAVQLLGL